jgi:hypothetical protein
MTRTSSTSEKPLCQPPRKLTDWLNSDGQRKVHSMIDKVYQPKNLRDAWEKVKANRGSGGVDGQSLEAVEQELDQHLHRLHEDLRTDRYQPLPVRRVDIPKAGKPGEWRPLGIPGLGRRNRPRRGGRSAQRYLRAYLSTSRDVTRRMGDAGRAKVEREFTLERLVRDTLAAYRRAGWADATGN